VAAASSKVTQQVVLGVLLALAILTPTLSAADAGARGRRTR